MVVRLITYYFLFQLNYLTTSARDYDASGGIQFEARATWTQVLAKARSGNKMIFVDCYATWCGPCKMMDREVYTKDSVAKLFNRDFICLKLQMDSSQMDDAATKRRYSDAKFIRTKFKVMGYPTFLFFNAAGQLVDRRMGAMDATSFFLMGMDLKNGSTRYDVLLNRFNAGERNLQSMNSLIWTALRLNDTSVVSMVAIPYFHGLDSQDRFSKSNIQLLSAYTRNSIDMGFQFFYVHSRLIDSIMGSDVYAEDVVQMVIFKEIVDPWWDKSANSDTLLCWPVWVRQVAEKYGTYYSNRILLYTQMHDALRKRRWAEYTHDLIRYVNQFGPHKAPLLDFVLNNSAWSIFQHSSNNMELQQAHSWSGQSILLNPNAEHMDTYANICYKLGQRGTAIMWEEVAIKMDSENQSFKENLQKMRDGKPTWPLH